MSSKKAAANRSRVPSDESIANAKAKDVYIRVAFNTQTNKAELRSGLKLSTAAKYFASTDKNTQRSHQDVVYVPTYRLVGHANDLINFLVARGYTTVSKVKGTKPTKTEINAQQASQIVNDPQNITAANYATNPFYLAALEKAKTTGARKVKAAAPPMTWWNAGFQTSKKTKEEKAASGEKKESKGKKKGGKGKGKKEGAKKPRKPITPDLFKEKVAKIVQGKALDITNIAKNNIRLIDQSNMPKDRRLFYFDGKAFIAQKQDEVQMAANLGFPGLAQAFLSAGGPTVAAPAPAPAPAVALAPAPAPLPALPPGIALPTAVPVPTVPAPARAPSPVTVPTPVVVRRSASPTNRGVAPPIPVAAPSIPGLPVTVEPPFL